jgi:hypothetical protein
MDTPPVADAHPNDYRLRSDIEHLVCGESFNLPSLTA